MATVLQKAARPIEIVLGLFFLASALIKAWDADQFAVQIGQYQVLADKSLLPAVAIAVLAIEGLLGTALTLGLRPRALTFGATALLLLVFSGLILYAWQVHNLEDCGCLGAIKMSPQVSILKNLALLVVAVLGWAGFALVPKPDRPATRAGAWAAKGAVAVVVGMAIAAGGAYTMQQGTEGSAREAAADDPGANGNGENAAGEDDATTPDAADAAEEAAGKFAGFVVQGDDTTYRLADGDYLVAVLSMDCEHCAAAVPQLNELFLYPDLPPVVALGYEEQPDLLEAFRNNTGALFPIQSIGDNALQFFNLIGAQPPRISYVREGHEITYWDDDAPSYEQVQEALQSATEE